MKGTEASFWQTLDQNERSAFKSVGRLHDFRAGQTIMRQRDTDGWGAVLMNGHARVLMRDDSVTRVIAIRHPGDIVGELSLIDRQPRSATVQAAGGVRALVLTMEQLWRITERHPRVLRVLLTVVSERLREADRRRIEFAADVRRRIACLLVEYVELYGQPSPEGTFVPITSQADLASIVGTSRGSVARVLRELRDLGLVHTSRGAVVVRDFAGLRALAAPVATRR
ncbi:MAG TPA: Crp/Fnr family transcriptional regulator [Pseudonocardiaceae bacterium]|jgi:CRP-like cAMP-binding protein|nr:Crp/Fnr family transcriptional regulator [Pseudonocardiaceae bacterium]